jgi:hypothetical protein
MDPAFHVVFRYAKESVITDALQNIAMKQVMGLPRECIRFRQSAKQAFGLTV